MDQEKRQRTAKDNTKIGAVIILVISAIVFIPFGGMEVIEAFLKKNDSPVYGKYNGKEIRYEKGSLFTKNTEEYTERLKSYGYQIDDQAYYSILNSTFAQTVQEMAFTEALKKAGYTVPEEAANRILINYYRDEKGNYSPKIYNNTDKATKNSLRENVENRLLVSRYTDDLLGSTFTKENNLYGIKTNSKETAFINEMGKEMHAFSYVTFNTANFPKEEAAKWAADNTDKFLKYDLSAITLDDEAEAKTVLKQINSNEITFEDAASEKSQKYYTDDDGKVTRSYRYQLEINIANKEDAEKVMNLSIGSLSDVVATTRGFTIFRCNAAASQPDIANDETLDVILTYIKSNEHGYIEEYYTNIANDFIANATMTSFEEAGEEFGVTPVETSAFPINYDTTSLFSGIPTTFKDITPLAKNDSAFQKLFALKLNETSSPIVLGTNVMVFKCVSIIENDQLPSSETVASSLNDLNENCLMNTLMSSDKVVNNVFTAYLNQFTKYGKE